MNTIQSFRDLLVWQKSMELAVRTYRVTQHLPRAEDAVLGYQLRKSSLSIPSNVAEGWSRHSTPAYVQHLWIAHGSGGELETQLEVGRRLRLLPDDTVDVLIRDAQEVGRMINGLAKSLGRGGLSQQGRRKTLIPDP
jgi:four helix bundle protein